MNKKIYLSLITLVPTLFGCSSSSSEPLIVKTSIVNGGFETSDLSGWTIEYGNAYEDDSVSSKSTFMFEDDENHNEIDINKTGNWFLSGKGYDDSFRCSRTGAIRSSNFYLSGDGSISMKLAGGASTLSKGENALTKSPESICFVGIYLASSNQMIARFTNEYFVEHTENYVDPNKYNKGVYLTDNFYEYSQDLSDYLNQEMYIRIVDCDTSIYYGYLSVDDIRIGGEDSQADGEFYVKSKTYIEDVAANSKYEIKNPGFETGSLAGWEVKEGLAFSSDGVNHEDTWWNENITYNRDGEYHYGLYEPSYTGIMRSSTFELGGSGYISFKLGGCHNNNLTYLSVYVVKDSGNIEVGRYSNDQYKNEQFPYVSNGMRLLNMTQYVVDLSMYLGETMYIEVVDKNSSNDDLDALVLDSVFTYHATKPNYYLTENAFEAKSLISLDIEVPSEYQVLNGTFETGDLTGWTTSWNDDSLAIGEVTSKDGWWNESYPFNKKGTYLFSGESVESNTGYILSSSFIIGGSGYISFLMGGGNNPALCYISIIEEETNIELARFSNRYFNDLGTSTINNGSNLMNMVSYKADLSEYLGKTVRIKVVDNSVNNWGLITVDSFITYYPSISALPENALEARNMLTSVIYDGSDQYQVLNGNFETGDLTGWTIDGNIGGVSYNDVWWNEFYDFEKEGTYFFNGWNGEESATGSLTSSSFKVSENGLISFKLGGAKNSDQVYIEIIDSVTEEVYFKFGNSLFKDLNGKKYYYSGKPNVLSNDGYYLANMATFVADISEIANKDVKIRIVDNAISDWGLFFVDDFVTSYKSTSDLPSIYINATPLNS